MSVREFPLPDVGEGLTEAEIVTWRVGVGDTIEVNQPIVDIETAKAVVELPSPFAGQVVELLVPEGRVAEVGTPILAVEVSDREPVLIGYGVAQEAPSSRRRRRHQPDTDATLARSPDPGELTPRAKPGVRALARELGVDLAKVPATGPHDDITAADVHRFAVRGAAPETTPTPPTSLRAPRPAGGLRTPVRSIQRTMAQAMVRSVATAPHVSTWVDVDVSATMRLVEQLRSSAEFVDARVTPMTIAAAAALHAVRRTPIVNASWIDLDDGESAIETYPFVNLGFAVAGERGLMVPNIRDAGSLSLPGLAKAITDLTERARQGRLRPADSLEGTLTITNIGVFGVDGGTPILNPGEAAILATGRVVERPWAVEGGLAVRPVMTLSLSFDHRVVDGAAGATFLADVAEYLRRPPTIGASVGV